MTIKQIQYFASIAKEQSFSVASSKLYVSQAALSVSMENLEKDLGIALFKKDGRHIALTEVGRKLYNYTNAFLEAYTVFESQARSLSQQKHGKLQIGIPGSIARFVLSDALALFCNLYPQVQLNIINEGAHSIQDHVAAGSLSFGFAIAPIAHALHSLPIISDELVAVMPCNHPLNRSEGIEIKDLCFQPLVMLGPEHSLYHEVISSCNSTGFSPHIAVTASDVGLLLNFVKNGLGITVQAKSIAKSYNDSELALVPLDHGRLRWDIHMIYLKDQLDETERLFFDYFNFRK